MREPEVAPSRIFTSRPVKEEKEEEVSDEIITEASTGKGKLSALAKILSLNSNKTKAEPKGQQRVEPQLIKRVP